MKKLVLILLLISGAVLQAQTTVIQAQTIIATSNIDGEYEFIYNDTKCVVEFISSSNTFKEYDGNNTLLTTGTFNLGTNIFSLVPVSISSTSQINIPVTFKVTTITPQKMEVTFTSSVVTDQNLVLDKL